jgi:hypothetical protein
MTGQAEGDHASLTHAAGYSPLAIRNLHSLNAIGYSGDFKFLIEEWGLCWKDPSVRTQSPFVRACPSLSVCARPATGWTTPGLQGAVALESSTRSALASEQCQAPPEGGVKVRERHRMGVGGEVLETSSATCRISSPS